MRTTRTSGFRPSSTRIAHRDTGPSGTACGGVRGSEHADAVHAELVDPGVDKIHRSSVSPSAAQVNVEWCAVKPIEQPELLVTRPHRRGWRSTVPARRSMHRRMAAKGSQERAIEWSDHGGKLPGAQGGSACNFGIRSGSSCRERLPGDGWDQTGRRSLVRTTNRSLYSQRWTSRGSLPDTFDDQRDMT
jgi:hypothetical protein